jgi:hypothetical protein
MWPDFPCCASFTYTAQKEEEWKRRKEEKNKQRKLIAQRVAYYI